MKPRVLIVDDDPSFLATVRVLLESEGCVVAGEALNGADGITAALALHPDIVLVDVNLPDVDGFEVVQRLRDGGGAPRIVLTSIREASDFGDLISASGADAFVAKAEISAEALVTVLTGRTASQ